MKRKRVYSEEAKKRRYAVINKRRRINWEWVDSKKVVCKYYGMYSGCGGYDKRTLQFHHRDKKNKLYNVSSLAWRGLSRENIQKEIDKCEVICANCHAIQHYDPITKRMKCN